MFAILMGLPTISPRELDAMMQRGPVTVIDVNAPERWKQHHVPGAINLDHETYTQDSLSSDPAATLVFYCSNPMCRKAPIAARRAVRMGFSDARVMAAGIKGWLAAQLPTESQGQL